MKEPERLNLVRRLFDNMSARELATTLRNDAYIADVMGNHSHHDRWMDCASRLEKMEACLLFIRDECDWERGDFGAGGDNRIGPAINNILSNAVMSQPAKVSDLESPVGSGLAP